MKYINFVEVGSQTLDISFKEEIILSNLKIDNRTAVIRTFLKKYNNERHSLYLRTENIGRYNWNL